MRNLIPSPNPAFRTKYKSLASHQQDFLKVSSICYQHTSRNKIRLCLAKAGLKNHAGKAWKQIDLKPVVTALVKSGLLVADPMGIVCPFDVVEYITCEAVADKTFEKISLAVESVISTNQEWTSERYHNSFEEAVRDLRIALYRGKSKSTITKFLHYAYSAADRYRTELSDPLTLIFSNPVNGALLDTLPSDTAELICSSILSISVFEMTDTTELFVQFVKRFTIKNTILEFVRPSILLQYSMRGELSQVKTSTKNPVTVSDESYKAFVVLLQGDYKDAVDHYEHSLENLKNQTSVANAYLDNFIGVFYPVALLALGDNKSLKKGITYCNKLIKNKKRHLFGPIASDLKQTMLILSGQKGKANRISHSTIYEYMPTVFTQLFSYLTLFWQGQKISAAGIQTLQKIQKDAESSGYYWIAIQVAALLSTIRKSAKYKKILSRLRQKCSTSYLVDIARPKENWEQVLQSLLTLQAASPASANQAKSRLVWFIEMLDEQYYEYPVSITPRLQKLSKTGTWSKGRPVALKTLQNYQKLDYLTKYDKALCQTIRTDYESTGYYYGRKKVYYFDLKTAIPALIDHPLLFSEEAPHVSLEFAARSPELHITQKGDHYTLKLEPPMRADLPFLLIEESPIRTGVVQMTAESKQLAEIIESPVDIPVTAKESLLEVIPSISSRITVHTDLAGTASDIKNISADPTPYIQLTPYSGGLKMECLVKPFKEGTSFHQPGKGGRIIMAEINGQKYQAERDQTLENKKVQDVLSHCPVLSRYNDGTGEWVIHELEDCLELIADLQDIQDDVVVQWPQGESLRVTGRADSSSFSMNIKKDNDWFEATGQLRVDKKTVLDLTELLKRSRQTDSRFIKLSDGQFLALSKNLKRRLEEIDVFSEDSDSGIRFSPLASLALEDVTNAAGKVTGDTHWKKHKKRFAITKFPEIPSTFQASLRDYQQDGFRWLARLSQWGVGACLADDMGLGKTVQAIAAILLRATEGPTLIIAPTSVLMNWTDEVSRFAPTLNMLIFGSGDRKKMLANLNPFDVIVTSYGLLQTEGKKLSQVAWQTIVLDEAQAIKNMATKRSKAAMALQGQFRLITTGTPIENHLGELWNLFQFINPGLLGSIDSFNQKFAIPIERDQDGRAKARLKKLIQPYILRRLKQEVLQELPARTETTLMVEMSDEERSLYEAQRLMALEKIKTAEKSKSGQHMQILAEITRLRRFCCNPELVVPDCNLSSSKLKVFGTVVTELLDNGHKALVFSQFVGHLSILRNFLDSQGISYQYLDGSTPVKKRQKRIRDFQSGFGDIFLISLKAGGSGLNLTAADYVIHMDPWWNPAVEDQASDRAHRIGQKRPVTIYRLVVKDSIEEKILSLHSYKRDLASNLLEGTDMSGKIKTSQLLKLIKG